MMSIEITWGEVAQLVHKVVFPIPMNTKRHSIIHDIVFVCHRMKDFVDKRLLIVSGDWLETKMIIRLVMLVIGAQKS